MLMSETCIFKSAGRSDSRETRTELPTGYEQINLRVYRGFPELYMAADVEQQWQIRQILSVSDQHHLDEVMSAWDRAGSAQRDAVRAALGVA